MRKNIRNFGPSLAVLTVLLVCSGCKDRREITYRIVLPDDYIGWVRIDFGARSALRTDSKDTVTFRVGDDGTVWTDAAMVNTTPTHYEFFYQTSRGLRAIPEDFVDHEFDAGGMKASSDDPRGGQAWYFFVGSQNYRNSHAVKDYVSHVRPLPTPGRITGPLPNQPRN
jgi:hypothetical protein